jgi:hypothetical protein
MDVFQEHLECYQDPIIEKLRKAALGVAEKYSHAHNIKLEININNLKENVNINITVYNI